MNLAVQKIVNLGVTIVFLLYDNKGKFYYDTISSWWCNVHGHNHPKIKAAIKKQLNALEHVLFAGFTHKPAILLAEKLISVTPENLEKVFHFSFY